jgi:hypothetical protein
VFDQQLNLVLTLIFKNDLWWHQTRVVIVQAFSWFTKFFFGRQWTTFLLLLRFFSICLSPLSKFYFECIINIPRYINYVNFMTHSWDLEWTILNDTIHPTPLWYWWVHNRTCNTIQYSFGALRVQRESWHNAKNVHLRLMRYNHHLDHY